MKTRVFCLPFAGASSFSYNRFHGVPSAALEFVALDLPGRGKRVREKLLTETTAMAMDLLVQVEKMRGVGPYALYGHSMGALLAVLIARELVQRGSVLPVHLFVSGSRPPSLRDHSVIRHLLPRGEFIDELIRIGGSPREILEDKALMDFFEPILRADFRATETFVPAAGLALDIPITCLIGRADEVTGEQARAWKVETTGSFEVHEWDGDHFFIFTHTSDIVTTMERRLRGEGGLEGSGGELFDRSDDEGVRAAGAPGGDH